MLLTLLGGREVAAPPSIDVDPGGVLAIKCPLMPESRHRPRAMTGILELPGGAEVDAHRHDEHQIAYAARGVLSIRTGTGTWVAPRSLAIWIPAGTVHEHRAYGHTDLHLIGLPLPDNPLGLTHPAVVSTGPLLRALIMAYTAGAQEASDERQRLRAVLLDQLEVSAQQPVHLPEPTDSRLAAVCDILRANPSDNRPLADLGKDVGASQRTLSRLFRADAGMTFPQWRTQLRLHQALILLAEGRSVTTVSHACGWASTSAFIEVFKNAMGFTPGAQRI